MQSDSKQIYKELAQEKGKPEQMYKDLGNFIFQETYNMLRNPQSLILKLKGLGNWHLRKQRMEIVVNEWTDRTEDKKREEFDSDVGYIKYQEKRQRYLIFKERLKDYQEYIDMRTKVREIRFKTQFLLTPDREGKFKSE